MAISELNKTELKYIRRDLDELKKTTTDGFNSLLNQGYVKRDELKEKLDDVYQTIEYKNQAVITMVETNKKEYDEFSGFFKKLNYAIIFALVSSLIGLILVLK